MTSLYGNGPSPYDVAFQGWGAGTAPPPPGTANYSLAGGTYGNGSSVPDNYAGSFGSVFFGGLGNAINVGMDIWDRVRGEDDPRPPTPTPRPAMPGLDMNMLLLMGGLLLLGFMFLRTAK